MYEIENAEFVKFTTEFFRKNYRGQRYGQAFYEHFKLDRMTSNRVLMNKIYEAPDYDSALTLIRKHFNFN